MHVGTTIQIPPAIVAPATTLADLAARINAEYEAGEEATRRGLEHYRAAGEALLAAKERCGHGAWLAWLRANVRFSQQQASRYMQLARLPVTSDLAAAWRSILGNAPDDAPTPHVARSSGHVEWYTPWEYIEAARRVLGNIDLDPASSDAAQQIVRADAYYRATDDGLAKPWAGRVWLNPPYDPAQIGNFIKKLCDGFKAGQIYSALLLVNNATETRWFQEAAGRCSAVCFPAGRIRFLDEHARPVRTPLQGQAVLYFGTDVTGFRREFGRFGACMDRPAPAGDRGPRPPKGVDMNTDDRTRIGALDGRGG